MPNQALQDAQNSLTQAIQLDIAKDGQIADLKKQIADMSNISIFDGLELTPWLLAPGTAANTGSAGNTAVATQGQPGINSAWFGLSPNGPWANGYWYKKLGVFPKKTTFIYSLSFMFGSAADAVASNCVELDIQQVITGLGFNPGWQFDFNENLLRVWNRSTKSWVATGKSCPRWKAGQWVRIVSENHRDGANVYHDAMTIDGVRVPINMTFPATPLALPDMLNCAVQLDGNKAGTAYKLYIDQVKFTAS